MDQVAAGSSETGCGGRYHRGLRRNLDRILRRLPWRAPSGGGGRATCAIIDSREHCVDGAGLRCQNLLPRRSRGRCAESSAPSKQLRRVALDGSSAGQPLSGWLAPAGARPSQVAIDPDGIFNIIYSSGTTGEPKGIVHSHRMRWRQIARLSTVGGYSASSVDDRLYAAVFEYHARELSFRRSPSAARQC